MIPQTLAGLLGAVWTWAMFLGAARAAVRRADQSQAGSRSLWTEDLTRAELLSAIAIFMMFHYY